MIAQHRIHDETNELTQVKELLDPRGPDGCGHHRRRCTRPARHRRVRRRERDSDYLLQVKGDQPGLQRAIYDKINAECDAASTRQP